MTQMYNYKDKQQYLKNIQDDNAQYKVTIMIFDRLHQIELKYNKDVCRFNKDQMIEFLSTLNVAESTLRFYRAVLSKYLDYCIEQGMSNKNVLKALTAEEITELNKETRRLDFNVIYDLVSPKSNGVNGIYLKNIQDMLMVYLIFLGFSGTDCSILSNLKYEHVDVKNKLIKSSMIDKEYFDVKVDDLCLYLIKLSKDEKVYRNYETNDHFVLDKSDYLIRKEERYYSQEDKPVSRPLIHKRIEAIKDYIGVNNFTIKAIELAGVDFFVKKVFQQETSDIDINNPTLVNHVFNRYRITSRNIRYQKLATWKREYGANNEDVPS